MKRFFWSVVSILSLTSPLAVADENTATGFLNRSLTIGDEDYAYQVYVPSNYDPLTKWPVVIDLHGKSFGGRDGLRQTRFGLANAIRTRPDMFPIIGIFPQSPDDDEWRGFNAELVIAQLEATLRELSGERDRVYLIGLSMGGAGIYHIARDYPDQFAALVVSCSSPLKPPIFLERAGLPEIDRSPAVFASIAEDMPDIPIWIFHGTADTVVPINEAKAMVAALEETGRVPRFTEYPEKGHIDGCGLPYLEEELWSWVLSIEKALD